MNKSKWTPFFLLLSAAVMVITATAGSLTVIAWITAGVFLLLAAISLWLKPIHNEWVTRHIWHFLLVAGLWLAAALFGFLRYHPALMAAPGFTLDNVTEPDWLNGRIKTAQAIIEQTPCTYALLGWQDEESFYYKANCAESNQIWRYVVSDDRSEKVAALPSALYAETIPATDITDGVLADIYPRELSKVSRETFIAGNVISSENGRFTALISRHVYGPQDVLLLTPPVSFLP